MDSSLTRHRSPFNVPLSPPLSPSLSLSRTLSPSLSLSPCLSLFIAVSLPISLFSLSLSLSTSLSLPPSLCLYPSLVMPTISSLQQPHGVPLIPMTIISLVLDPLHYHHLSSGPHNNMFKAPCNLYLLLVTLFPNISFTHELRYRPVFSLISIFFPSPFVA